MSRENEIFSKLNELRKLIDDHSKGRNMGKTEKQPQTKKSKVEYSDFSLILSGNEDDTPVSQKQKNKKRAKSHSEQKKLQTKAKPKSVQKNTSKSQKTKKHSNTKSKSPKKYTKKTKEFNNEEEEIEIVNNDLSIHRDNLHKIFSECKTLDSMIEASLSPKPIKNRSTELKQENITNESFENISNHSSATPSQKKSGSSTRVSKNSNSNSKASSIPSKTSQNSQKQHISSTSTFVSSNDQKAIIEEEEEEIESSHDSNNEPSNENNITNSTSSQVYVVEQATQTHLSSSHHSYESSKNYSNSQHLLDIDGNPKNKNSDFELFEEEEEDILSEDDTNLKCTPKVEQKNQTPANNTSKKDESNIQVRKTNHSSESESKNQPKPHNESQNEVIIFDNVQTRSIKLNDQDIDDNNSIENSNLSSEFYRNLANQSSDNSSSDISIEAINSNSSDDNAGQVIQSPVKTPIKKQPEYLEPIIDQTDSESENKKQKNVPPQIKIPESNNAIHKNKSNKYDDIIDIDLDLENREDIIEILATSSSDEDNSQPPNIIFSSSTTPKSSKTPEFIKPVFSSESESKHTTDTDKEKEEKLFNDKEDNFDKSTPIYLNEDEVEIVTNKDLNTLKNAIAGNNLLLNVSSSENLSFEESADDKDLILLHTTDSSGDDSF